MKFFSRGLWARFLSLLVVCSMVSVSFGSAANARFVSPDTMDPTIPGVGTNRYAYAENDPINRGDPSGHVAVVDDIIVGLGIACVSGGCEALAGVAVALGIWGTIDYTDDGKVNLSPLAGTVTNMAGKDGIYTGLGGMKDIGEKGVHWKGVDGKGQQHEVGIRPGSNGDFEFEPVGGSIEGKRFQEAVDSLQPTLGSEKGLQKLLDQVKAAQDYLKDKNGYGKTKKDLDGLSGSINDKLSGNGKKEGGSSNDGDNKTQNDNKWGQRND